MVKFGHQLLVETEAMQLLLDPLGCCTDAMNYKQLKKLLKVSMAFTETPMESLQERVRQELPDLFWQRMLSSSASALDEAPSTSAWFSELLKQSILDEAQRINDVTNACECQIAASRALCLDAEGSISEATRPVDVICKLQQRWLDISSLEDGMRRFRLLNLTGFCKILKKFDKNWCSKDGQTCTQTLLPCVLKVLHDRQDSDAGWDECLNRARSKIEDMVPHNPAVQERLSRMSVAHAQQVQELLHVVDDDGTSSVSSVASHRVCPQDNLQTRFRQSLVSAQLPLVASLRGYSWQSFRADFMAALVISVAGIPKAMAYANLAGLPVAFGIATLYVPNLVYAVLGGSRQGATSPQSVPALLLGQMVTQALEQGGLEDTLEQRVALTMSYTFLVGVMLMVFGSLRFTFLLSFISKPVLSGFISASVLVAAVSTFKSFLRVKVEKSSQIHVTLSNLYAKLPEAHLGTVVISACAIALMILLGCLQRRMKKQLAEKRGPWWSVPRELARVPVAIWIVLVGVLLGANLCEFQAFTEWEPVHKLVGRGATFPADLYNSVGRAFECHHYDDRVLMEYTPTGSGDGLRTVLIEGALQADFATSDIKPADSSLADFEVLAYPMITNFVCPVVNIPMIPDSHPIRLVLDLPTVADIFSGRIQDWADPRIKALNPNLPWHTVESVPIKVVVRGDDSGTTNSFSKVLSECAGCNASFTSGMQVQWPANVFSRATSNEELVRVVSSEDWSIGYSTVNEVRQAEAKGSGSACAALRVQGTVVTSASSLYPLNQTNYLLVPASHERLVSTSPRQAGCRARQWLHSYVTMMYSSGQETATEGGIMSPEPDDLDLILCPGDRHHAAHRRLPSGPPRCNSSVTAPKCQSFKMVGYVPPSIPDFQLPSWALLPLSSSTVMNVVWLSIVALLEHVAVVKRFAGEHGYAVSFASDTCAVGLANVVGSAFGSFVVAAGFSRSALNAEAKTQMSLVLSVFLSLGLLYLVSGWLSMLPDAFLGVVLFMAVIGSADWRAVLELRKLGQHGVLDLASLFLAFSTTCLWGVIPGMSVAVGFSIVMFILNSSFSQVVQLGRIPGTQHYEVTLQSSTSRTCRVAHLFAAGIGHKPKTVGVPNVKVLGLRAPLWFGNVDRFVDTIEEELRQDSLCVVVIDMSCVAWIDATACAEIKKVLHFATGMGKEVRFAHANAAVRQVIVAGCGTDCAELFFESVFEAETSDCAGRVSEVSKRGSVEDTVISVAEPAEEAAASQSS